jgi:cysteine desulfurase
VSEVPERVYFDNSATTPLDPRVADAMSPFMEGCFGNPSSLHWAGREARAAVDRARAQLADLLGAKQEEIVFTASGTESDNMALIGCVDSLGDAPSHIVTSPIEHPAITETARILQARGVGISTLPVDREGVVDSSVLPELMQQTTRLVSIMAANNVVGTLQPIREIGKIAQERGALFHTDAVQAVGKTPFDLRTDPIDLMSVSAHKLHGPKGVGALFVRTGVVLSPLVHGGGQEFGLRSATENVAGIVGFGAAAAIAKLEMAEEASRLVRLRDRLLDGIASLVPSAYLIGHRFLRLPGHICLGFAGLEGEAIKLLLALDAQGIAISSGSACRAHHGQEPSSVLQAMGFDQFRAGGSLRITLGRFNTDEEVTRFLEVLPAAVRSLRPISSLSTIS